MPASANPTGLRSEDDASTTAMQMTCALRDFLIEHIDGPVPILLQKDHRNRRMVRSACIRSGFVHPYPWGTNRPKETRITDKGRQALCAALADWAEALIRAERLRACFSEKRTEILVSAVDISVSVRGTGATAGDAIPRWIGEPDDKAGLDGDRSGRGAG